MWKAWLLRKCFTSRVEVLNFQLQSNLFDMAHTLLQLKRRPACFRLETTGLDFNKANLFWIRKKKLQKKIFFSTPFTNIYTLGCLPYNAKRNLEWGHLKSIYLRFYSKSILIKFIFLLPRSSQFQQHFMSRFPFAKKNYKHKL